MLELRSRTMKIKKVDFKIRAKLSPAKEKILSHIRSRFFRDTTAQLLALPSVVFIITAWVLSFYYFQVNDYLIPTRYSSFLGVTDLGQWYDSYQLPLFLTFAAIINIILANVLYQKDKFISYILVATNIFISIVVIAVIVSFGSLMGV